MKKSLILKWVWLALASLGIAVSTNCSALAKGDPMCVQSQGGLYVYHATDDAYWFAVGGRAHFDETLFMAKGDSKGHEFPSGALIETAFLKFSGGIGCHWTYNMTLSFLPPAQIPFQPTQLPAVITTGFNPSVDFEDLWVNYRFAEASNFRVGQFTPPTSIDDWSRHGTVDGMQFLRVALDTFTFSQPTKVLGLWVDTTFCDMFNFSLAVYQPRQPNTGTNTLATPNNYFDPFANDRVGVSGRLFFAPMHDNDCVFHVGAIGRYQQLNSVSVLNGAPVFQQNLFYTTPEALARNTAALVNTGFINGLGGTGIRAKSYSVWTAETLAIFGPFSAEAEFHWAHVQQVADLSPRFYGWHVQAGYVFTGESRFYDFCTGTVQDPTPCSDCGAWELAVRYSYVNLNNKNILGGRENNLAVALNWYINKHVFLAANYIAARIYPHSPTFRTDSFAPARRNLNILAFRMGVKF